MSSLRSRRLFLALLALPVLFLLFLFLTTRHTVLTGLFTTHTQLLPDEIFGLLHFVTSPDEAGRAFGSSGATTDNNDAAAAPLALAALEHGLHLTPTPNEPVPMTWYALGAIARASGDLGTRAAARAVRAGWDQRLATLRHHYPLVVFSKTYCPYSKRAKRLLETYALEPPPKIIEVDLRADGSHIKAVLARLTHQSTFPNVVLQGRSLGGSDELMQLHQQDELRRLLEAAGVKVGWAETEGAT